MSFPYYLIRTAFVNSNSLFLSSLFSQINQQQAENIKPTSKKPKILGDFSQSDVRLTDKYATFHRQKSKYVNIKYSKEPYKGLRCWVIFDHLNSNIQDLSSYHNDLLSESGYPCLSIGEDNGLYGRNLATTFNRDPSVIEYYRMPNNDTVNLAHADFDGGFTIMLVFRPNSFDSYDRDAVPPEINQTLYQVVNDVSKTGGISIRYDHEGRVKVFYRRTTSTNYDFITEQYKVRLWAWNTLLLSYDPLSVAPNKMAMQINGNDVTDDTSYVVGVDEEVWSPSSPYNFTDHYFAVGNNLLRQRARVQLGEYRLYDDPLTTTQMRNLFRNKLTIENNQYGQTYWTGFSRFPDTNVSTANFDATYFDSVAFHTS